MAQQADRVVAMKDGGYYSKSTGGAKDVIDRGKSLILDAVAAMEIADSATPFTFADMGCADGGTSMAMVGEVLAAVRARAPSRPLQMVYTDLPTNDFRQIFCNVQGLTGMDSYHGSIDNLFVYASGTSFHERLFADGTLNLGFSATASHYITETPAKIAAHVHMVGAAPDERTAYEDKGRHDWENLLTHRAHELVPGGRLVYFNFGIDEEGRYLGDTGGVSMFDTFNRFWAELADDGVITGEEYLNTNFLQCYRDVGKFCAPLRDAASPVYAAGLRLDHVETRVVECPYAAAFREHGDAARFAEEYIPTLRSWSEHTFAAGLSPDRPAEQRAEILDDFYGRYQASVAAAPEGHAMDYVHVYTVMSKTG